MKVFENTPNDESWRPPDPGTCRLETPLPA
jgi:hypothetical protein